MNIASIILLALILAALIYGIIRIKRSKGACEDCDVSTCPVHENMQSELPAHLTGTKK